MNDVAEEFFKLMAEEQKTVRDYILSGVLDIRVYDRFVGKYSTYESLPELWKKAQTNVMRRVADNDEDI